MSFAIATVGTLNTATTQQVSSGSLTSGQAVVTSTDKPVVAGGNATVALGTTNAKVVLTGNAQLGIAKDANGNPINIGGASIVAEGKGSKVLNLNGADVSGATVDKSELPKTGAVPSDQTFNTFIKTDRGNDQVQGSVGADLIAGGKGKDIINSGAGDDVVLIDGGGQKKVSLGSGQDQLAVDMKSVSGKGGGNKTTLSDFNSADDKLVVDGNRKTTVKGIGTDKLVINSGGKKYVIKTEGGTFSKDDIEIV